MTREPIKDAYGRIVGYLEDQNDYIVAYNAYGKRLGWYQKSRNMTYDDCGRIICQCGDTTSALIMATR